MRDPFENLRFIAVGLLCIIITLTIANCLVRQASQEVGKLAGAVLSFLPEVLARLPVELAKMSTSLDVSNETYAILRTRDDCTELSLVSGGKPIVIDRFPVPMLGSVRFSSNHQQIVIAMAPIKENPTVQGGVYLYNVATRARSHLWSGVAADALFSPDGRHLVLETEQGVRILDLQTERIYDTWARRVISDNFSPEGELLVEIDFAPHRVVVAWKQLLRPYSEVSPQKLEVHPVVRGVDRDIQRLAWSPCGKWVAYAVYASDSQEELWLAHTQNGKKEVVHKAVGIGSLRWTSDSELLFVKVDSDSQGGASAEWMRFSPRSGSCVELELEGLAQKH